MFQHNTIKINFILLLIIHIRRSKIKKNTANATTNYLLIILEN